jgi:hypothetical protein
MDPRTIDGNASLQDQENTLNFTENTASVKTVSYVRAEPANSHENLATFEDVPQGVVLPPVKLAESAAGSDIWVTGVIKKVAMTR